MPSQRNATTQPVATGDTRRKPSRRTRRDRIERRDLRAALRDAAALLSARRYA